MFDKEKQMRYEVPAKWETCLVQIAAARNMMEKVKKGMQIADFFVQKHGIKAMGNADGVKLELKPHDSNTKISDVSAINKDLQRMIDDGTLILFSISNE